MSRMTVKLEADNLAEALIESAGPASVNLKVDPDAKWDAEGLVRLASLLKGVAAALAATVALYFMVTVADATDWSEWIPGPEAVSAFEGPYAP